jgi:hypothetical protein
VTKRRSKGRVPGTFTGPRHEEFAPGTPECRRCAASREGLETAVRRGEGTPAELRQAIETLAERPQLGQTMATRAQSNGATVYYCPRCTDEKHLIRSRRSGRVVMMRV